MEHYYNNIDAIINITDIDDKIINKLNIQTHDELLRYTKYYTDLFMNDLTKLSITRYNNKYHTVTDNIDSVKDMILTLKDKGYIYNDGNNTLYFDSSKIDEYPFPLIKKEDINNINDKRDIIRSNGVRDNKDFTVWKFKENESIYWELDKNLIGRPGWHIECSAIAKKHLKEVTFHIGGEDLKFPHHTCEILQSESYDKESIYGKYWLHIGFLNFNGDKMSKSLGNIKTLDDLNHINKFLLRYYLFQKPYRMQNNFMLEEINTYIKPFLNFHKLYSKLKYTELSSINNTSNIDNIYNDNILHNIMKHINNDLDTRSALIILDDYVNKLLNSHIPLINNSTIISQLESINKIFKILDNDIINIPQNIINLVILRNTYKINKKYTEADNIRKELIETNYIMEDNKYETIIIKWNNI